MWRILQNVHSAYRSYDGYYAPGQAVGDLDPILVAGRANMRILERMASETSLSCATQALGWLRDLSGRLKVPPLQPCTSGTTALKYVEHLKLLQQYRVVEAIRECQALYVSPYFAIPKADGTARAILNAKRLSKLFEVPPVVNLCEPTVVIEKLAQIAERGPIFTYTCDIRHWFHQLSTSEEVRRMFAVHCGGQYYCWRTLPMGFAYSPRICQCLAWAVILHAGENADPRNNADGLAAERDNWKHAIDPPRFLTMRDNQGTVTGHIFLTYDNVGIFCNSMQQWRYIAEKIASNMAWANIELKEHQTCTDREMNRASPMFKGTEYLGLQYAHHRHKGERALVWRHAPTRTEKWSQARIALATECSPRKIATAAGILLWDAMVRLRPLCLDTVAIDALRGAASAVGGKQHLWDEPHQWPQNIIDGLKEGISAAQDNPWCHKNEPNISATVTVFTDASDSGMGAVYCTEDGSLEAEEPIARGGFTTGFRSCHIFLKEMAAAVWGVSNGMERRGWRNVCVRLVVDNSAVAFGLRSLHSSNDTARSWMKTLHGRMQAAGCILEICQVLSADNPADEPSRGKPVCHDRLKKGWAAVCNYLAGRLSSQEDKVLYVPEKATASMHRDEEEEFRDSHEEEGQPAGMRESDRDELNHSKSLEGDRESGHESSPSASRVRNWTCEQFNRYSQTHEGQTTRIRHDAKKGEGPPQVEACITCLLDW